MSDEQKAYVTTERAGYVVAGQRIPPVYPGGDKPPHPEVGFPLQLTETEAEYELRQGTIELKKPAAKKGDRDAVEGA